MVDRMKRVKGRAGDFRGEVILQIGLVVGDERAEQLHAGLARFGVDDGHDFVQQGFQLHGLKPEILRSRELQESLHDLVEPSYLAGNRLNVLDRECEVVLFRLW